MRSNLDYQRFEIIGGLRSHLLFFFFGRKNMLKEKAVSPRSHPASWHIHTHVYFVHIRIHICQDLVHLDSSGPPGVSSRPLGSHPSTPSVQCVCVCVYTHTNPHTSHNHWWLDFWTWICQKENALHYQAVDEAHVPPSADSLGSTGCHYPDFQVLCGHCELGLTGNRQTWKFVDACLQESMESQCQLARRDILGGTRTRGLGNTKG